MPTFLRRNTHHVLWVLLVAFSLGVSANCLVAARMTEAQKACCASMAKGCGPQSKAQSCCSSEIPRVDQFAAAHRLTAAPARVMVVAATIETPLVPTLSRVAGIAPDRHGAHPPGLPQYLLTSLLRV